MPLVISQDLVVSESLEATQLGLPVFGWHNVVAVSTVSAETADSLYPVSNLANPSTVLKWKAGDTTAQSITVSISPADAQDWNYVGIARHNLGSEQISVTIETGDPEDPTILVQENLLADDKPAIFRFETTPLQVLRVKLGASSGDPASIAVLYVGKLLVMERGFPVDQPFTPLPFGRRSEITNARAEAGDFLGRIVLNEFTNGRASFAHLTPDWYRAYFDPFVAASKETPFFYAWKADDYPAEVGFAWMTNDPVPEIDLATGRFKVDLEMGGIVR